MPVEKSANKNLDRFNFILSKGVLITMDDDLKMIQEGKNFQFPLTIPVTPLVPQKEIKIPQEKIEVTEKPQKTKEEILKEEVKKEEKETKIEREREKEKEIEEIKRKEEELRKKILEEKEKEKKIVEEIKKRAKEEEEKKEKEIVEKIRQIALQKKQEEERKEFLEEEEKKAEFIEKERKIIEKIREEALKKEQIEKEIMIQKVKDSLLRAKLKLEGELEELKQKKASLEKLKDSFSQNFSLAESALKEVLAKEKEIEAKYQELEKVEREVQDFGEKRNYEKQRWELSKERRKIEEEKWIKSEAFGKAKAIYNENLAKIKELEKQIQEKQNNILEVEEKIETIGLQKQKENLIENLNLLQKNLLNVQTLITENLKKYTKVEEKLQKITESENEIEKKAKEIERKEKTTISLEDQKEIEKQRWQIEEEREKIEKERWQIEEELAAIDKKNISLEEEKIKIEESIKKITSQIGEIDIFLEYGIKKGKEIIAAKKAGLSLEKLKVKEEKEPEKKVIIVHKVPLEEKIEEKISEIEKEKYESELQKEQSKIEEEKKRTLEEKRKIELEKQKIEFEKRRLEELKKLVGEKEIAVKEHILTPKEKVAEMLTKVSPEEELKRKEFLARVSGKPFSEEKESKEIIFKPMAIAKPPLIEKIIIRVFILLLLAGIGVAFYLLYYTYIFPWQKRSVLPNITPPLEKEEFQTTTSQENLPPSETSTQVSLETSTQNQNNIQNIEVIAPEFLYKTKETKIIQFSDLSDAFDQFNKVISGIKNDNATKTEERILFYDKNKLKFTDFSETLSIFNKNQNQINLNESIFTQTNLIVIKENNFISVLLFVLVDEKEKALNEIANWEKSMKEDLSLLYKTIYDKEIKFPGSFKTSQKPYKLRYLDSNSPNIGICYTLFSPNGKDYYLILSTSGKTLVDVLNKLIMTM